MVTTEQTPVCWTPRVYQVPWWSHFTSTTALRPGGSYAGLHLSKQETRMQRVCIICCWSQSCKNAVGQWLQSPRWAPGVWALRSSSCVRTGSRGASLTHWTHQCSDKPKASCPGCVLERKPPWQEWFSKYHTDERGPLDLEKQVSLCLY